MTEYSKLISDLPIDKRALLELQLKKKISEVASKRGIHPQNRDTDTFRLSFAQRRLWFHEQLNPGSFSYNIPVVVRISGNLNLVVLEQSVNEIIRRHEVLRTTFTTIDGQPAQVILPASTLELDVDDLTAFPSAGREAEALRLIAEEARRPFDLVQGPLLRVRLLCLGDQDYILQSTMHHIVSDDWSIRVFSRELAMLYKAFHDGKPSPIPELSIQYVDFAEWQRDRLQGQLLEAQFSYWKRQLGGAPPLVELPTDRPRPPLQTYRGATHLLMLPGTLSQRLQSLSQREGVTLFMMLLGAFEVLLHRYTGQDDIVVGTPIAGRNRPEIEGLIGFFVNTLVLRTDLSGDPTFRELLGRVRGVTLGAYDHQDLPFERLVEELQPERNLSHNPLFQVAFAFQDAYASALHLPGLTATPVKVDTATALFDLTLFVEEHARGLRLVLEYNTDLFDAATIARMMGHFQTLLEGIVANSDRRLSGLPLLTDGERSQLLVEWNDTRTAYLRDACIHELLEVQVERTPDTVAVVFEDQHLTYRELNLRANQLAHHLQGLGVGPEVLVGLCVERSLEVVVGLLGVLKAGGAYVPLDAACPRERLAFVLEDTQTPVLLTQQRLVEKLPQHRARAICLDADRQTFAKESEGNPLSRVTAANLAYLIYTSGSTGSPKGVQIEHRGLLNLVFWHQRAFAISPLDRATQVAGLAFDASVWELWPYLAAGAGIHLPDEETRALPARLRDWLVDQRINIGFLPTPLAEAVLPLDWPRRATLRTLLTGGEKLHHYPAPSLPFELVNNYGPTENTVVTTSGLVLPKQRVDGPPSIGRPITNNQVYLLDQHMQPVPVGVAGELCIGGDSLARGYLSRPELTAEVFIPNPFSEEAGARLYRTGDLAHYLPDGNIEFLGRIDHQVKIRGFRIELGEIETVLGQHPAVRETAVLAREDVPGDPLSPPQPERDEGLRAGKRLVAYVVPSDGQDPIVGHLRRFLGEKLPEYMVPSAFVVLEALPLMPSGKVDRRALPAPGPERPALGGAYVMPRTLVEEVLADIWGEVLGVEEVGIHDNFFELGGHSLLVTQVVSHIRQSLGVELPMQTLFRAPTVGSLAAGMLEDPSERLKIEKTAELLIRVAQLSEEEVETMLAKRLPQS